MQTPEYVKHNPVHEVQWIHIDKIESNQYNPNSVASHEMRLLYISIREDGYTQPIVTVFDEEKQKYVIIDGFHRYATMKMNPDIYELNRGLLPLVVMKKSINDRMASTIRHNRARGKHSVKGQSNVVFEMLKGGWTDSDICNKIGLTAEELTRLKHITGFSKLFKDADYSRAYETERQVKIRKEYKEET